MSTLQPILIESTNLSLGWGQALIRSFDLSSRSLSPMVISIGDFDSSLPHEDQEIRDATDAALMRLNLNPINISALTIFPYQMWCRRGKPSCEEFSKFCVSRYLPRLKKLDKRNVHGTYFGRMMGYTGTKKGKECSIDQLSFVIQLIKRSANRRPRQSALQISCFDPAKDHTGAVRRGFPCLQQVSVALNDKSEFAISAYYPTQHIFDRGYGNYLGLCHLGAVIAHETGLKFTRFNCFVGRPEFGNVPKSAIGPLVGLVRTKLA